MIKKGDKISNKRTGQKMHFLLTGKETDGKLLRIECISPESDAVEPEHIHPQQINRFEIISGTLTFDINGNQKVKKAGDKIDIQPNVPHFFYNSGKEDAHYIQEFEPALNIDDFFEIFFDLANTNKLNSQGIPNLLHGSVIMLKYQNEIRVTNPSWLVQSLVYNILSPIGKLIGYKAKI